MRYHRAQLVDVIWAHHGSQIYHFYEDCPELKKLGESHQEAWYEDDRHESWRCCKTCSARREQERLSKLSGRASAVTSVPPDAEPVPEPSEDELLARHYAHKVSVSTALAILAYGVFACLLLYTYLVVPQTNNWDSINWLFSDSRFLIAFFILAFFWTYSRNEHLEEYVKHSCASVQLPTDYLKQYKYVYALAASADYHLKPDEAQHYAEGRPITTIPLKQALESGLTISSLSALSSSRDYRSKVIREKLRPRIKHTLIVAAIFVVGCSFAFLKASAFIAAHMPS